MERSLMERTYYNTYTL